MCRLHFLTLVSGLKTIHQGHGILYIAYPHQVRNHIVETRAMLWAKVVQKWHRIATFKKVTLGFCYYVRRFIVDIINNICRVRVFSNTNDIKLWCTQCQQWKRRRSVYIDNNRWRVHSMCCHVSHPFWPLFLTSNSISIAQKTNFTYMD